MRAGDFIEKRKSKRLILSLPMRVIGANGEGKEEVQEGITMNISFYGAYVVDIRLKSLKPEDTLKISLSVPMDDRREFPFSRFEGKARVVRVEEDGAGLEFNEDMSRLFVAN